METDAPRHVIRLSATRAISWPSMCFLPGLEATCRKTPGTFVEPVAPFLRPSPSEGGRAYGIRAEWEQPSRRPLRDPTLSVVPAMPKFPEATALPRSMKAVMHGLRSRPEQAAGRRSPRERSRHKEPRNDQALPGSRRPDRGGLCLLDRQRPARRQPAHRLAAVLSLSLRVLPDELPAAGSVRQPLLQVPPGAPDPGLPRRLVQLLSEHA